MLQTSLECSKRDAAGNKSTIKRAMPVSVPVETNTVLVFVDSNNQLQPQATNHPGYLKEHCGLHKEEWKKNKHLSSF